MAYHYRADIRGQRCRSWYRRSCFRFYLRWLPDALLRAIWNWTMRR